MNSFKLIVLGCSGGPQESNVSGYLLAPASGSDFIALDAGSLLHGIEIALKNNAFQDIALNDPFLSPLGQLFQKHIKAYLISHPHLDHIAGLVMNSQADIQKPVFGTDYTLKILKEHVFNGKVWPNYSNEGPGAIGIYHYNHLKFAQRHEIPNVPMTVTAFPLNHGELFDCTCYLVEKGGEGVLYFGDTTSDERGGQKENERIWKAVAPLVKEKNLKGILIECSYPDSEKGLGVAFHLTPKDLKKELKRLEDISQTSLKGLKVVVTHRKNTFSRTVSLPEQIAEELKANNEMGIQYIFPKQGEKILL